MALRKRLWLAHCHLTHTGHLHSPIKFYNKLMLEGWTFFTFSRDATRKTNILVVWEALPKQGESCGVHKWAVASSLSSASQIKGHLRPRAKAEIKGIFRTSLVILLTKANFARPLFTFGWS